MRVSQILFFAASMLAAPTIGALAQSNNPAGNYGSNRSVTASPGTADSQAASGMHTGDVGSGSTYSPAHPMTRGMAANPNKEGATGHSVVPGNNSTAANTSGATRNMQTGGATSTSGNK